MPALGGMLTLTGGNRASRHGSPGDFASQASSAKVYNSSIPSRYIFQGSIIQRAVPVRLSHIGIVSLPLFFLKKQIIQKEREKGWRPRDFRRILARKPKEMATFYNLIR